MTNMTVPYPSTAIVSYTSRIPRNDLGSIASAYAALFQAVALQSSGV